MIDLDVVHSGLRGGELTDTAATLEVLVVQIVGEEVVNAVASTVGGSAAGGCGSVGDEQDSGNTANAVEADGYVVDAAERAFIRLVLGGQEDGISGLAESAPAVIEEISLEQDADRALELEVVLDDVRVS